MPHTEAIEAQRKLLDAYRKTLHQLLVQRATHTAAYAPPALLNGIEEARTEIARVKAVLRSWDVEVEDHPDDTEQLVSLPTPIVPFWRSYASTVGLGAISLLLALIVGMIVWRMDPSGVKPTPSIVPDGATMSPAAVQPSTSAASKVPTLVATISQPSTADQPQSTASTMNIAPQGVVSVSSVSTQGGEDCQQGAKAVDGNISGYPEDPCSEWASDGELEGAWLKITFDVPHKIDKIVLFDRPTRDDQVLDATIRFSDGSTIKTGQLSDEGGATEIPAKSKITTSITVTVDKARGSVIGLSEIQIFGQ